jgi:hypothetical protein
VIDYLLPRRERMIKGSCYVFCCIKLGFKYLLKAKKGYTEHSFEVYHSLADVLDEPGQAFLQAFFQLGRAGRDGPLPGLDFVDLEQFDDLSLESDYFSRLDGLNQVLFVGEDQQRHARKLLLLH